MGCASCREPLGMGYLRGLGVYGLGQDDPYDLTSLTDSPVDTPTITTSPVADSTTDTGFSDADVMSAYCAGEGLSYNASTDLCNVPNSTSSSTGIPAAIASDITALSAAGQKIAQIATGQTGSLLLNSNTLLIGGAILAAILIIPAIVSKR